MIAKTNIETSSLSRTDHELVDLLMRQYQVLKQDMLFQMSSYKNHVRNSQIVGTILIAMGSFISTTGNYSISDNNKYIWIGGVATITTISYYLIHDVLESVFAVKALEEYLSFLEAQINRVTAKNALLWQSSVADQLWPMSASIKNIKPPIKFLELYQSILILGITVLFPIYVYYKIVAATQLKIIATTQLDWVLIFWLVALAVYLIYSAYAARRVWKDVNAKLREEVRQLINQGLSNVPR